MLARVLLLIASVTVSLCIFEAGLRWFPPREFARLNSLYPLMQPDPLLGHRLRPNMKKIVLSEDGRTEFTVETNELGMREIAAGEMNGRRVILGLGDSFLFGDGVEREQSIMAVIESRLNETYPGHFRTVNAGVPGYSTNQEILYYLTRAAPDLNPEIVVLFFYINDVVLYLDTHKEIRAVAGIPAPNDTAALPVHWGEDSGFRIPRFLKYLMARRNPARVSSDRPEAEIPRTGKLGVEAQMFLRTWDMDQDVRVFNLGQMLWALRTHSPAKILIVCLPSAIEVEEDGPARAALRAQYDVPPSEWHFEKANAEIEKMLVIRGIPHVNLHPVFRDHWKKTGRSLFINRTGHFTAEGHRVVAEAVLPSIVGMIHSSDTAWSLSAWPADEAEAATATDPSSYPVETRFRMAGPAGDPTNILMVSSPSKAFEKTFEPATSRDVREIQFRVPPQSDTLLMGLFSGGVQVGVQTISPPPSPTWKTVRIPHPFRTGKPLRLLIRAADPSRSSLLFTPPAPQNGQNGAGY